MKNRFRIHQSEYGYFYFEEKVRPMYFTLSYFEFFLESVFGINKYVWQRDYMYQFKTYNDAEKYINENK